MQDGLGRLLIVDDLRDDREILQRACERLGYDVVEADSGVQALDMLERESFDLVLLDILMPEIDGLEVLRRIRERHAVEALPVIMVTARTRSEDVGVALELGANDYVTKPLDLVVAKARIAAQIERKRAEDRSRASHLELEAAVERVQLAMQAAQAASKAKTEFLANMSHEIRTPLNGVLAMAEMLARSRLKGKDREMVEIIRDSGHSLERLLNDVLDLARVEAGAVEIADEPLHLGEIVRAVAALCRLKADEKGVALRIEIAEDADRWFRGDATRVRQILNNLLSNAVKFTDAGEVCATAALRPDGMVQVAVRDTGVGFDPANKDQVFGRFQQADGSITRRFGGSGLGLAISRQLAELMGGGLDCTSEPGVGSVFRAELPLAGCDAPVDEPRPAPPEAISRAIRILMADDHPTNRKVAELILAQAGVELVSVENGQQALDAFQSQAFDVVLMDMQMPVMDGLTAVRRIRACERDAGARRTPVLMLTASALPEHVAAALAAGADGHVAKPINPARLMTAISEACEKAEKAAAA